MATSVTLRSRRRAAACAAASLVCVLGLGQPARALSTITIEEPVGPILPGDTFAFLLRISGSVALTGYTIDLRVAPQAGAVGSIMGDAALSNFHASDNLIAQGGNGLHATFSTITSLQPQNPGLMINGLDAAFLASAVPGPGQDVLAEVVMTASANAFGDFDVYLGGDTELFVDDNDDHNELYPPALITIHIPEPGYLGMLAGLSVAALRRRRKSA